MNDAAKHVRKSRDHIERCLPLVSHRNRREAQEQGQLDANRSMIPIWCFRMDTQEKIATILIYKGVSFPL